MSAMAELAAALDVFDALEDRAEWGGFGYLGERRNHRGLVGRVRQAEIDAALLDVLGEGPALFEWANSPEGRKFGDHVYGGAGRAPVPARVALATWRGDWRRILSCTCAPDHIEAGGYDAGCPVHDPS